MDAVRNVATLLKTDEAALAKALTHRVVAARGEVFESKLVSTRFLLLGA